MFEHRVGTLIVLKNFGVKDTKLVSVVLGYQTVNNFYELYETGQVLCDTHRSFDDKIKVLKVRPYDQDTWQEYLSTMGFVPEVVYCYIAVEEDTVLNKYFYPYKYQFNDTVVLKKDIPKGIAYTIHKFSWVGKHPIGSKKRHSNPAKRGFRVSLKPLITGRGLNILVEELETNFDLYD